MSIGDSPISDGGGNQFVPHGDAGSGPVERKQVKQSWVKDRLPKTWRKS